MRVTAALRGSALLGSAQLGSAQLGWAQLRWAMILVLACAVAACRTAPREQGPATPPSTSTVPEMSSRTSKGEVSTPDNPAVKSDASTTDSSTTESAPQRSGKAESDTVAPCACMGSTSKPALVKRKSKPVAPPSTPPAAVTPAVAVPAAAGVARLESPSESILGRRVSAQDGEDLGRVVDVLADRHGRVRIAVIEFGGFLGVGNRRIAVDWSLLKFKPGDADTPVIVEASKAKLQLTPEYKGSERPLALMAPAAPVSATADPP